MSCVWVYFCMIVATTVSVMGAPGPDCSAASLQELPPRVRTMCEAFDRLSNLLQSYIDDQANYQTMVREGNQIYPSGVKRQDVDHVFLRFGRRR
ncbi:unnamed protein product [Nesidiocoris tenuis]|uniref:Neuropeptide signaling pathway n=2 Tax=Nesidiocoris tenuis TaxID=355587 RepID=A0ABN7AMZ6_9HEMI|nr:neuropeptide signaling pathway [Nesidiocoris tenuis]CAB0006553.1 unnamed protein product [Nesidiocoris tenuis]